VPGCSEPLAAQAVVDAAITFCENSLVLREVLDPLTLQAGLDQYEFSAPSNQEVVRLLNVWVDGQLLRPIPAEQVDYAAQQDGAPSSYYVLRQDEVLTVQLYPTPIAAGQLSAEVALRPTREATQLPTDLYTYWLDAVLAGTLAHLLALPATSFSNPAAATHYMGRAATLTGRARIEGSRGRLRTSLRISPRSFT
jgi:hypothetical protein